jgi:hypothetical protein
MNLERQDQALRIRCFASSIRLQRLSRDKVHSENSKHDDGKLTRVRLAEGAEGTARPVVFLRLCDTFGLTCILCVYITSIQMTKCLEIASRGLHTHRNSLLEGGEYISAAQRRPVRPRSSQPRPDDKTRQDPRDSVTHGQLTSAVRRAELTVCASYPSPWSRCHCEETSR